MNATPPPPEPGRAGQTVESVAFVSLGCAKNLVDSERMLGLLAADGIAVTPDAEDADAVVINTCGFLEASKEESLREIRHAVGLKRAGRVKRVVVAGCLVQRHKTALLADVPGVDRLVGVFDRDHIVRAVRGDADPRQSHGHFLGRYHALSRDDEVTPTAIASGDASPAADRLRRQAAGPRGRRLAVFEDDRGRLRLTPRHYAYLRISEGCNQGCAFCTIPSIRGPMRSKPPAQILEEAAELAGDGAVELLLIGQDTTSYGVDIGYGPGLAGLLDTLDRELPRDVAWLRLMYAYPSCFTDVMIDALAGARRVAPYVDMPLQHIADPVLARMKRKVTADETRRLLDKLHARVPGLALRTTFIAGSPGETDADHRELVDFVREGHFEHVGVFAYSAEPGTPMGRHPDQVSDGVRQARLEEIMLAQQEVVFARNAARVGTTAEVVIDAGDAGSGWTARTRGQAPDVDAVTHVSDAPGMHPGAMLDVTVTDYRHYDLVAEPVRAASRALPVLA